MCRLGVIHVMGLMARCKPCLGLVAGVRGAWVVLHPLPAKKKGGGGVGDSLPVLSHPSARPTLGGRNPEWSPCLRRLGVIYVVGLMARCKFYFAWAISEAALIASGFCFHGYDASGAPPAATDSGFGCIGVRLRRRSRSA